MIYKAESRSPKFGIGKDVAFVSSWGDRKQTFHIVIVATAKARVYAKRTCGDRNTVRMHSVKKIVECPSFTRVTMSHAVT